MNLQKIVRYCSQSFKAFCCLSDEEIKDDIFALETFELPNDNWFEATDQGGIISLQHGSAPPHLFALVDDRGQEGKRWIPVIIEHPIKKISFYRPHEGSEVTCSADNIYSCTLITGAERQAAIRLLQTPFLRSNTFVRGGRKYDRFIITYEEVYR